MSLVGKSARYQRSLEFWRRELDSFQSNLSPELLLMHARCDDQSAQDCQEQIVQTPRIAEIRDVMLARRDAQLERVTAMRVAETAIIPSAPGVATTLSILVKSRSMSA